MGKKLRNGHLSVSICDFGGLNIANIFVRYNIEIFMILFLLRQNAHSIIGASHGYPFRKPGVILKFPKVDKNQPPGVNLNRGSRGREILEPASSYSTFVALFIYPSDLIIDMSGKGVIC
jgi:hypothetical protein